MFFIYTQQEGNQIHPPTDLPSVIDDYTKQYSRSLWAYLSIKPPALLCNFAEGTDEITGNQAKTPDKILQGTQAQDGTKTATRIFMDGQRKG